MSPGNVRRGIVWAALSAALLLKMILLEPLDLGIQGFRLVIVAALLPMALLMRWAGVAVIATACGLAHGLNHGDIADAMIAAGSVGIATAAGVLILRQNAGVLRWLAAGWVITGLLSLSMATGNALFLGYGFQEALITVLLGVWAPLNLLGVPAAILLNRSGHWALSQSQPWARGL
ncbi:MAG: hypothetical protein LN412_01380 [Candidatus Thermoplasmatota archaeon]|nr:hypothetical protein [Candidatus Thermoplasmatota archaeon]